MKTDNTNTATAIVLAAMLLAGLLLFQAFVPTLKGLVQGTSKKATITLMGIA